MRPPEDLFSIHREVQFDEPPVLLYALGGFVDAGAAVRLASEHVLATMPHQLIATFDADEMLDYRARRPRMRYVADHFASVDLPEIALHEVTDPSGQRFLLLAGPEPDYQWQRFLAAVDLLVAHFSVRMAVGLSAIPWPVPHTRPLSLTWHGSDPSLVAGRAAVAGEIDVPGHVGAMLELHLGEQGLPSLGISAQVPHYLVQFEYPRAASTLLGGVTAATGIVLPATELDAAAEQADRDIAEQVAGNAEFATAVVALEQQYDQIAAIAAGTPGSGGGFAEPIPTADEIAEQVERFLSSLGDTDEDGKGSQGRVER